MAAANPANRTSPITQGDPAYPARLTRHLGADAPPALTILGPPAPLAAPMTAFLCSRTPPGATMLKAFDQAALWRNTGRCVISGFHSPLERQCLDILLRGRQPIVMVLARAMSAPRRPPPQLQALQAGRLTLLSPFAPGEARTTAQLASLRNRVVAALAECVVFGFVSPGGSLAALRAELQARGAPFTSLHGA